MKFLSRKRICISMMMCMIMFFNMTASCTRNSELPLSATKMLENNFRGIDIRRVKVERTKNGLVEEYEVFLVNGWKLEFDADGYWKEIDCQFDAVPAEIIPQPVAAYVSLQYPDQIICTIERNTCGYDIGLSNRQELEFDLKGNFLRID